MGFTKNFPSLWDNIGHAITSVPDFLGHEVIMPTMHFGEDVVKKAPGFIGKSLGEIVGGIFGGASKGLGLPSFTTIAVVVIAGISFIIILPKVID